MLTSVLADKALGGDPVHVAEDDSVTAPPATIPARSWKTDDEMKRWVLAGHKYHENMLICSVRSMWPRGRS